MFKRERLGKAQRVDQHPRGPWSEKQISDFNKVQKDKVHRYYNSAYATLLNMCKFADKMHWGIDKMYADAGLRLYVTCKQIAGQQQIPTRPDMEDREYILKVYDPIFEAAKPMFEHNHDTWAQYVATSYGLCMVAAERAKTRQAGVDFHTEFRDLLEKAVPHAEKFINEVITPGCAAIAPVNG